MGRNELYWFGSLCRKSIWKRMWTYGKTDYLLQLLLLMMMMMMMVMVMTMIMIMIVIFLDPQKVTLSPYSIFLTRLLPVTVLEMLLQELNPNASACITPQTLPPAFLYWVLQCFINIKAPVCYTFRPPLITSINILHLRCGEYICILISWCTSSWGIFDVKKLRKLIAEVGVDIFRQVCVFVCAVILVLVLVSLPIMLADSRSLAV